MTCMRFGLFELMAASDPGKSEIANEVIHAFGSFGMQAFLHLVIFQLAGWHTDKLRKQGKICRFANFITLVHEAKLVYFTLY
mgnify:CR=1 FL=1